MALIQVVNTGLFHTAVVRLLGQVDPDPLHGEVQPLLTLITMMKIDQGHDEILAAVDKYFAVWGRERWCDLIDPVREHILAQKAEAEARANEGINLNDLEQQARKLLSLLNDRHPELDHWNRAMRERLQSIYKIISRALGK